MSQRVLLAMSGGVDSSVAALLLKSRGYDVIGLFMRTGAHIEEEVSSCALPVLQPESVGTSSKRRGCCSAADASDARRVADRLDIPFYALDFEDEFGRIIDYFVDEYTRGRTPNPCIMCNNWLKFGRLWEFAQEIEADAIATGHYARICRDVPAPPGLEARYSLRRSADAAKDQSYVLFGIRREILPHLQFPVGDYSKREIRAMAREMGLRVADKPDSQEICFVPNDDYQRVIQRRRPEFDGSGEIVDTSGKFIARHEGIERYTVGQRKGLGIALGERYYVVEIDATTRRVVVGPRDKLLGRHLEADHINWLCDAPENRFRCEAKIRYLHAASPALVTPHGDETVHVEFDVPQAAITPGQAVVFYDGDRVLGGGQICNSSS